MSQSRPDLSCKTHLTPGLSHHLQVQTMSLSSLQDSERCERRECGSIPPAHWPAGETALLGGLAHSPHIQTIPLLSSLRHNQLSPASTATLQPNTSHHNTQPGPTTPTPVSLSGEMLQISEIVLRVVVSCEAGPGGVL